MNKLLKTNEYGIFPNSYDLLKLVALMAMFVDHVGFYFFPEAEWLRVIGRISFPTFLLLVGYSRYTRFDLFLLIGACLVFVNAGITGAALLPFNILFAILVCRVFLAFLDKYPALYSDILLLWLGMTLLYYPSSFAFEYGSVGLMFAVLGRFTREGRNAETGVRFAWLFTLLFYLLTQQLDFEFPITLFVIFIILTMVMGVGLMQFTITPLRFPENNGSSTPNLRERITVLAGRNTLVLYVLHIILLQWLGKTLHPEIFTHGFSSLF